MAHQFKQGARISIYFSIGLAIPLKEKDNNYCIRFEREYGYGTSIADANNDFEKLQQLFAFFKEKRDTKECINWGLVNITQFGVCGKRNKDMLILEPKVDRALNRFSLEFKTYRWEWRNFTKRERAFISNKLNKKNYCHEIIKSEHYYSDAYRLLNDVADGDTDSSILIF